jgi:hypothetical protein
LRRGLGQGKVVAAEDLARSIAPFDANKDGEISRTELVAYLHKHKVGGPWFCDVVSRTLWKFVEQRLGKEFPTLKIDLVARILNTTMRRGPRLERRYQIDPEAMVGYKPIQFLRRPGDPPPPARAPSDAKPRATPRGGQPMPQQRMQSDQPGRSGGQTTTTARALPRRPAPRRPGPRR